MALGLRLDIKQSQTLVMTPQLQQAIQLLQYSNMELTDFVLNEVEKNPLLEIGDANSSLKDKPQNNTAETAPPETISEPKTADEFLQSSEAASPTNDSPLDTSFDSQFENDAASDKIASTSSDSSLSLNGNSPISGGASNFDDASMSLENRLVEDKSLQDHLLEQLNVLAAFPEEKIVIQYMIGMLDESGYLMEEITTIAERFLCDEEEMEAIISLAQSMEPTGVFSRSLAECLTLQQKENDRYDPAMEALLNNLHLLGKRDYNALKRLCRVDNEDLKDMIEEIQQLNPKPGLIFEGAIVQTVIPDIFIKKNPKGKWIVELNSETLPKVLLNNYYCEEIETHSKGNKQEKEFLENCLNNANWLVKALDQRARTILKVGREIVRHQSGFLEKGIRHLKPLNLKTIAEAIDMHESTVSRVTSNKYIATSRGIFELKYFFNSAISSTGNAADHAAEAVKHTIKVLIDDEDIKKILSDDKLVILLKDDGIKIARRTVAKYREALKIPSSIQRRRIKNSVL
jgi:RNA polymerase sigma-54 factor